MLRQAHEATERIRSGHPLSPFDGVPVAVKDEVDMVPYPTTVGTAFLGSAPCKEDATVVARMRAAGALLIGKANMHEIGIGVTGLNPNHGTVRNPYDTGHYTGGSSSGSGAALRRALPGGHRCGRRRLDPHPVRLLRRRRAEAHLRAGERMRGCTALLERGALGAAGGHRHRCSVGLRRHGRTRPERPHVAPPAAATLQGWDDLELKGLGSASSGRGSATPPPTW